MDTDRVTLQTSKALEIAETAWANVHRGLPNNPMTRAAAIPAKGILAAAILDRIDRDGPELAVEVEEAILTARRAWEQTKREPPGNPIAATAERSVIGILAAGILNSRR